MKKPAGAQGDLPPTDTNGSRRLSAESSSLVMVPHRAVSYTHLDVYKRQIISSNERLRGYHAALQEWGVAFQEELLFEGNYQLGREAAALEHFLKHRVSAIFSFNDMMAFGLYQEIQKRQLSIPEDLSIVGFDDVFFGKLVHQMCIRDSPTYVRL